MVPSVHLTACVCVRVKLKQASFLPASSPAASGVCYVYVYHTNTIVLCIYFIYSWFDIYKIFKVSYI